MCSACVLFNNYLLNKAPNSYWGWTYISTLVTCHCPFECIVILILLLFYKQFFPLSPTNIQLLYIYIYIVVSLIVSPSLYYCISVGLIVSYLNIISSSVMTLMRDGEVKWNYILRRCWRKHFLRKQAFNDGAYVSTILEGWVFLRRC